MGAIITSDSASNSIRIDLDGLSTERKSSRIKLDHIRSIVPLEDDETIEVIFTNGEIYTVNYLAVESIDGDTNISSQQILNDKFDLIVFGNNNI